MLRTPEILERLKAKTKWLSGRLRKPKQNITYSCLRFFSVRFCAVCIVTGLKEEKSYQTRMMVESGPLGST